MTQKTIDNVGLVPYSEFMNKALMPRYGIPIKRYTISRSGVRGLKVTLPITWTKDLHLGIGSSVDLCRDSDHRLIVIANGVAVPEGAGKIDTYQISAKRPSICITLPKMWVDDVGVAKGDQLSFYRDSADRLFIVKE